MHSKSALHARRGTDICFARSYYVKLVAIKDYAMHNRSVRPGSLLRSQTSSAANRTASVWPHFEPPSQNLIRFTTIKLGLLNTLHTKTAAFTFPATDCGCHSTHTPFNSQLRLITSPFPLLLSLITHFLSISIAGTDTPAGSVRFLRVDVVVGVVFLLTTSQTRLFPRSHVKTQWPSLLSVQK